MKNTYKGRYIKIIKNFKPNIFTVGKYYKITDDDIYCPNVITNNNCEQGICCSRINNEIILMPENFNPNKKHYEIYY